MNENEGEKAQNHDHYVKDMDTIRSKSDDKNSLLDESFMEREKQLNMTMDDINESSYKSKDKYNDVSGDND